MSPQERRIAIHGFGRIGRLTARAAITRGLFTPVAVTGTKDLSIQAALFKVDTNYGIWPEPVGLDDDTLLIGDRKIAYFNTKESLPDWGKMGVEVVVDCTGKATQRAAAQAHLDHGAKRVLVSAVSKSLQDCDAVILPGINFESYDPSEHAIISM